MSDRISPEYLAMQKEMHERLPEYGISGGRYAKDVINLIAECSAKSVLDYGCGKSHLKMTVGNIVNEYDPAVEGKDGEPEIADIVVCTDVLEHIEPDKLDGVLEHIRQLSRKRTYVRVATSAALKTLSDGRNAHLIIENSQWWKDKLSIYFNIEHWRENKWGVTAAMRPLILVGEIKSIGAVANDERFEHCKVNVKLTDRRVKVAAPHGRVCILMCYGPSLADTWESAIEESVTIGNADVVSVSGAHDYLIERGVVPQYHVECDPRKHKGDMLTKPDPRVEYLMASCCHPDVVAKLPVENLTLWHLNNGEKSFRIASELEPGALMIGGGGSVGLRAIPLFMAMGYRRFIVHGMDCSYRDEGAVTHAGAHTGKKTDRVQVRFKGRNFITAPVLITYMRTFDDMRCHIGDPDKDPNKIEIILRGDGLLQHALLSGGAAESGPMLEKFPQENVA